MNGLHRRSPAVFQDPQGLDPRHDGRGCEARPRTLFHDAGRPDVESRLGRRESGGRITQSALG